MIPLEPKPTDEKWFMLGLTVRGNHTSFVVLWQLWGNLVLILIVVLRDEMDQTAAKYESLCVQTHGVLLLYIHEVTAGRNCIVTEPQWNDTTPT